MSQLELTFFNKETHQPPSAAARLRYVEGPDCDINSFIGNNRAKRRLRRSIFEAFKEYNHCCRGNKSFIGPPSTGKTTLAKLFAKSLGLPFIEIQPQSVKNISDVFDAIQDVLSRTHATGLPDDHTVKMVPVHFAGKFSAVYPDPYYIVPPCVVLIDEVHALSNNVVQGLLKATEASDCEMVTEDGKTVCTYNVTWIIATTDRGLLFDAFDTRFEKLSLRLYSKDEIAKIIKLHNEDWDDTLCNLVAKYGGLVPREAISFAKDVRIESDMRPGSWGEIISRVADEHGIDKYGMTHQRVKVLTKLGRRTMSASQLALSIGVKEEELKKFVMPSLLATTPDQPNSLVVVERGQGYCIMSDGLKALDLRGIKHLGTRAMTNNVREMFEGEEKFENEVNFNGRHRLGAKQ